MGFPALSPNTLRRTRRRAAKYAAANPNSYTGLTKTQATKYNATKKAKMFERIGRKVGRELGLKDKKIVQNAIEEASVSGTPNMIKLVQRLKGIPVFAEVAVKGKANFKSRVEAHKKKIAEVEASIKANAERKKADEKLEKQRGKEAHEAKVAFADARDKAHKDATKDLTRHVASEFARLYEGKKGKASEADINTVASLRAHGFRLSAAQHHHLKKHLQDATTLAIVDGLDGQSAAEGIDACAACELLQYLLHV